MSLVPLAPRQCKSSAVDPLSRTYSRTRLSRGERCVKGSEGGFSSEPGSWLGGKASVACLACPARPNAPHLSRMKRSSNVKTYIAGAIQRLRKTGPISRRNLPSFVSEFVPNLVGWTVFHTKCSSLPVRAGHLLVGILSGPDLLSFHEL